MGFSKPVSTLIWNGFPSYVELVEKTRERRAAAPLAKLPGWSVGHKMASCGEQETDWKEPRSGCYRQLARSPIRGAASRPKDGIGQWREWVMGKMGAEPMPFCSNATTMSSPMGTS
jgi:hypothetical protein